MRLQREVISAPMGVQVYQIHVTPRDTPGTAWRDIGPLRWIGPTMRPSEVVLEFRVDRGPGLTGGRIIGRRVLRRGRLGVQFAEAVRPTDRVAWPDWLTEAVNLAATELASEVVKAGATIPKFANLILPNLTLYNLSSDGPRAHCVGWTRG
jgi:hypothetical protein